MSAGAPSTTFSSAQVIGTPGQQPRPAPTRRLDPRWDDDLIDDHVVPCLVGFAHDAMARHVAGRDGTR
ncbi:MAG: hypothetical protein EB058_14700 [Proteobacteria bacterium]|nr:hypothetical protein [Pseudomonadota bacterium]